MRNAAESYVQGFYARFPKRVPLRAGIALATSDRAPYDVYPLVFENDESVPIGLIAMAPNRDLGESNVQIYLVSAFSPRNGHGTEMLRALCEEADALEVTLHVQAEPQLLFCGES